MLKGALKDEIDQLPIPVEPTDYDAVEGRLNALIQNALG